MKKENGNKKDGKVLVKCNDKTCKHNNNGLCTCKEITLKLDYTTIKIKKKNVEASYWQLLCKNYEGLYSKKQRNEKQEKGKKNEKQEGKHKE